MENLMRKEFSTSTLHYILLVPLTGYASDQINDFFSTHTQKFIKKKKKTPKRRVKMQSIQALSLDKMTYMYSDIITSDLGEVSFSFSVTFNFY